MATVPVATVGPSGLGMKLKPACGRHDTDYSFQPEIQEYESWQRAWYLLKDFRSFCGQ